MSSTYNSADSIFNHGFWLLLKKSIMLHKDSTSLKEKILVAKRILTPIIQDLMTDALVQTEIEKLSKFDKTRKIDGKNIKILFNKVKSDDAACFEGSPSDNEWATKILMEINRDLEEPFNNVLVEKQRRVLQEPVNETLLEKLLSVYQHLGEIIEHLRNRYVIKSEQVYLHESKNKDVKLFTSDLQVKFDKATEHIEELVDTNAELEISNCKFQKLDSIIFDDTIKHQVINYQCSYKDLYVLDSQPNNCYEDNTPEELSSPNSVICLRHGEELDDRIITDELKAATNSFAGCESTQREFFQAGKKEIVEKCLEGLDKVRTYLESLRIEESHEPQLCDVEKRRQEDLELQRDYIDVKQQEEMNKNHNTINYRAVDVPSVLPETKIKRPYHTSKTVERYGNEATRRNHPVAEPSTPKIIQKNRGDSTGKRSCSDMKVILRNGVDTQQKITNLVIFNPDDPCKSIIKMKDHENLAAANSNAGVSKKMKSSEMKIPIIFFCQKRNCVEKETMRNPLWPRTQRIESETGKKYRFIKDRHGFILLMLFLFKFYKFPKAVAVETLTEDLLTSFCCYESDTEYGRYPTKLLSCFEYESYKEEEFSRFIFLIIALFIYVQQCLENYDSYDKYWGLIPSNKFPTLFTGGRILCCGNTHLPYSSEKQILDYIENLCCFTSFLKGNFTAYKCWYRQRNKQIFFESSFEHCTNKFREIEYSSQNFLRNQNYHIYFFSYSVRSGDEEQLSSLYKIDDRCESLSTYPIWRIKKSKYYNLPNKKEEISLTEPNLTKNLSTGLNPVTKSNTQVPKTITAESMEQKWSGNYIQSRKPDVKRKVSFRDDVDFVKRGRYLKVGLEDSLTNVKSKESVSSDSLDALKSHKELTDLLITDSLMMVSSSSLPDQAIRTNRFGNKENWRNLDLTNSAQDILTKLSRSFDYRDEERYSTLESQTRRFNLKFFKSNHSTFSEVRPTHESQESEIEDENMNRNSSQLFNYKGFVNSDKQKSKSELFEERIINEKNVIEKMKPSSNNIQNEEVEGIFPFYDHNARRIEDVYDEYGNAIETFDRSLIPDIFDSSGNLLNNLYTKTGERITAIYNNNGKLLYSLSSHKLKFEPPRRETSKNPSSISRLFRENDGLLEGNNKVNVEDAACSETYSNLDEKLMNRDCNRRNGKLSTITSEEFDKTIEDEDKQYSRKVNSDVSEMPEIFECSETQKSEVSISWLNELLTASKVFARKKRDAFFGKKSKLRSADLKVLYDDDDNIITSVYDCKGNLLAESPSGNAERLIPFLFDKSGAFINGRFQSKNKELKFVFDKNKNIVRSMSLSTLSELLKRVAKNAEEHVVVSNIDNKIEETGTPQKLSQSNHAIFEEINSQEEIVKQDKYIRQLFDEKGNLLTAVYDEKGNQLQIGSQEFASNILPYLFDSGKQHSNEYYDAAGQKLGAIYDKNGKLVKNMIISLTRLDKEPSADENLFTKIKNYSELVDKIKSMDKDSDNKAENEMKTGNNINRQRKRPPDHKKSKLERDKLSHKIPISEPSKSRLCATKNNLLDSDLKSSTTVNAKYGENDKHHCRKKLQRKSSKSFYDANGNEIKEVYKERDMMKIKSGEAEKLAPFIFDRNGFLRKNIFDRYGRQITRIYDYKGREIRRTSVKTISSDHNLGKIKKIENKSRQLAVYNRNGNLVRDIYDRSGRKLVLTKRLKLEDLFSFIFHENGKRRRIYDEYGYEIGPLYDYKGNILIYRPANIEVKKKVVDNFEVFNKIGRKVKNFYDSEGTIIIALYNADAKLICSIEKGQDNAKILSRYLFDEYGRFIKGKYFDFRGSMIKRVYDSMENIVHFIVKSYIPKFPPYENFNTLRDSKRDEKKQNSTSKMNKETDHYSNHRQKIRSDKIGKKTSENLVNPNSQSDKELKIRNSKLKRPISAYYLKEPRVEYDSPVRHSCSSSSILIKSKALDIEYEKTFSNISMSKNALSCNFSSVVFGKENSTSDRHRVKDQPIPALNESSEKPENMTVPKTKRKFSFYHFKGYPKSNIDKSFKNSDKTKNDQKINCNKEKFHKIDESFTENLTTKTKRDRHSLKERSSEHYFDRKTKKERENNRYSEIHHRKRLPFFTNLREKFFTVVFENLNPYSKHPISHSENTERIRRESVIFEKIQKKDESIKEIVSRSRLGVTGKTENTINVQSRKRRKMEECDKSERGIRDIRSKFRWFGTAGDLAEGTAKIASDNRAKGMDSEQCKTRGCINTIYTNQKLLKKIQNSPHPAKVDSDLIYVVSKQSLPVELLQPIGPVFTQMHFAAEGKFS